MTNRLFTENKNIKENVKNDIFLKQQVEKIKSDSEKFANKDIAALTYTSFKKFYVTGSRKEYEYEYYIDKGFRTIIAIVIVSFFTSLGKKRYIDELLGHGIYCLIKSKNKGLFSDILA